MSLHQIMLASSALILMEISHMTLSVNIPVKKVMI